MKAVQFKQFGEPAEVLNILNTEMPRPGSDEVLVRMLMSPVNPSDFNAVRGTYHQMLERALWNQGGDQIYVDPEKTKLVFKLPYTPGGEGVGVVVETGSSILAKRLKGKRVVVIPSNQGNWQEYNVVNAKQALPVSNKLPLEQAATFFVNPLSAYVMIKELLKVRPGSFVLQTAAGSQLGRMVIRLGHEFGFKTINVVRRTEQKQELEQLGADHVIATDAENVFERVSQITNGLGVPYALDPVGGFLSGEVIRSLSYDGEMLVYGTLSGEPIQFPTRDLMGSMAKIKGFFLPQWMLKQGLLKKLSVIKKVENLILKKVLWSETGKVFSLDQVVEAMNYSEEPGRSGKTLIEISSAA